MKLLRVGPAGQEKPAVLDDYGVLRDLSAHVADIAGEVLSPEGLASLSALDLSSLPQVAGAPRIGPCVGRVGKLVCVGLNYRAHVVETKNEPTPEPLLFMKATTSICGADDPILPPRGATQLDYEVELGVVIGRTSRYVDADEAMASVAGYCLINDVSERAFQKYRGGQWTKGKSADSFGPIGPWFVTADEIPDPSALHLELTVNGEVRQSAPAADMIVDVPGLVSYISQFMTLEPGDIIATGTPSGVGSGMTPPVFLREGDTVVARAEGLGVQTKIVAAFSA